MKGIILAGGSGTRLYPLTLATSKQLMPIYDKPMVYYPLSTLMSAGIRDILFITTPSDHERFQTLLGDGSRIGCSFSYTVQENPKGLADAFIVGESFIGNEKVALILGDNVFYGSAMGTKLQRFKDVNGGVIFGYHVADPSRYGVVGFDENWRVTSIEEKPNKPKSNYAIPGLYFFDNRVCNFAKKVKPSGRGELEITDILNEYFALGELTVDLLGRGTAWLDTGTFLSMIQASNFVQVIESRQGVKIGCIEEIAYLQGFIDKDQLIDIAKPLIKSGYGKYLMQISEDKSLEAISEKNRLTVK